MQNRLENKVYAGFFVRFVAFAVDSMIAALAIGIVKIPFSIAAMSGVNFLKANFIFEYTLLDVLSYIGVAAYFVLLTYFAHSTPGKMLFRLEVVTSKEEWTFLNILYRETVGRFLSSLLCIGYFAVLVQKDKQGFHDMLCDTYVVYKNMVSVSTKTVRPVMPASAGVGGTAMPPAAVNGAQRVQPMSAVPVNETSGVKSVSPSPINEAPEVQSVSTAQSGQPYQAPVYRQTSAFQVTESHPVQAERNAINLDVAQKEEQQ